MTNNLTSVMSLLSLVVLETIKKKENKDELFRNSKPKPEIFPGV